MKLPTDCDAGNLKAKGVICEASILAEDEVYIYNEMNFFPYDSNILTENVDNNILQFGRPTISLHKLFHRKSPLKIFSLK